MVQGLRAVNDAVVPIHPLWPVLILVQVLGDAKWFTVLDLKDVFFIPVHSSSQYLFAFKWTNPHLGQMQQYTLTVLPQGFRDSPHLFSQALRKELREIHLKGAVLQYVDDILICSPTMEASDRNTVEVLNFLGAQGCRVSHKKAQISKQQFKYLGYIINPGSRQLSPDRKQAILGPVTPQTKKHLHTFLGMAGFCRIWIPGFGLMSKPLYEATKSPDTESLLWNGE